MELTVENLRKVVRACLFGESETVGGVVPPANAVIVEGVMLKMGFDPDRLKDQEQNIRSLLDQLPDKFKVDSGGGWTFLNACQTKDGVQWGEHGDIDQLVCLGLATGMVSFCLPREMWVALPGGMPYFAVDLRETPVPAEAET